MAIRAVAVDFGVVVEDPEAGLGLDGFVDFVVGATLETDLFPTPETHEDMALLLLAKGEDVLAMAPHFLFGDARVDEGVEGPVKG